MRLGGHFDYRGEMDSAKWVQVMQQVVRNFEADYRIEFLCHGDQEMELAEQVWPSFPRFRPETPSAYFEKCRSAAAAVVNRLHAAVSLSGLGIPCIAIGTDTRLGMTREIGIPSLFAPDVSGETLTQELRTLLNERALRSKELLSCRENTFSAYRSLLQPHLEALG
jgi:hypothetical protein